MRIKLPFLLFVNYFPLHFDECLIWLTTAQSDGWKKRVKNAVTSREATVVVNDLRNTAISWSAASKLFSGFFYHTSLINFLSVFYSASWSLISSVGICFLRLLLTSTDCLSTAYDLILRYWLYMRTFFSVIYFKNVLIPSSHFLYNVYNNLHYRR